MKRIFTLLYLLFSLTVFSQTKGLPFKFGERLTYSAHYHWGLFWMEAGEVIFQIDSLEQNEDTLIHMEGIGKTLAKYDWLFKVRDTFQSIVSYSNLKPIKFKRINYEGKDWVKNYYSFDRINSLLYLDIESKGVERKIDTLKLLDKHVLDIQTAVYYARLWDLSDVAIGETQTLHLILSGEFFDVNMKYVGKEIVKHKNGKEYACRKITTEVIEGMIFRANQEISIYVSDDTNQLPLVVKAPIKIGSVEAYLQDTYKVDFPKSISN